MRSRRSTGDPIRACGALLGAFASLGALAVPATAEGEGAAAAPPPGEALLAWKLESGWQLTIDPDGEHYPRYLADPNRPRTGLGLIRALDSEIEGAGDERVEIAIGARVPVVRLSPPGASRQGFQLDGEVGYFGQFDLESALDNLGWHGWYAFHLTWAPGGPLRCKVASRHLSAHIGDEFQEETGRERLNYTREDLSFALAWSPLDGLTAYAEPSWAHGMGSDEQEPWAFQVGLQLERPKTLWEGRAGWYAAADVQSFEENDWEPNFKAQAGLVLPLPVGRRTYRVGVEAYTGRSAMGGFAFEDESYLSVGAWIDL